MIYDARKSSNIRTEKQQSVQQLMKKESDLVRFSQNKFADFEQEIAAVKESINQSENDKSDMIKAKEKCEQKEQIINESLINSLCDVIGINVRISPMLQQSDTNSNSE